MATRDYSYKMMQDLDLSENNIKRVSSLSNEGKALSMTAATVAVSGKVTTNGESLTVNTTENVTVKSTGDDGKVTVESKKIEATGDLTVTSDNMDIGYGSGTTRKSVAKITKTGEAYSSEIDVDTVNGKDVKFTNSLSSNDIEIKWSNNTLLFGKK